MDKFKTPICKILLLLFISLLYTVELAAQDRVIRFNVDDDGVERPLKWGIDMAWYSPDNFRRGVLFMGADQIDVVRASFFTDEAITNDQLGSANAIERTDKRLRLIEDYLGRPMELTMNSNRPSVNPWFGTSGNWKPENWAKAIEVYKDYYESEGHTMISVVPLNEADLPNPGSGNEDKQLYYNIAEKLQENPNFDGVRISTSTLNCDQALPWYNFLFDQIDEGTTHQLAGTFDSYASFFEQVRDDGKYASNDELHNVMEAIVGVEYGMNMGIWWGPARYARGELARATDGKRLAYAEHRPNWTAAAVYRAPDGKVQAFLGGSERQAVTTTYKLISEDRVVFFDGHGPQKSYSVTIPGGTGYQQNQPNAERVVNITWGEDVQPAINGTYILVNRNSQLAMEVAAAGTTEGSNAEQNAYNRQKHQQWNVTPVDSRVGGDFSYFSILDANGGQSLSIDGGNNFTEGANIHMWTMKSALNQQWYLEYIEDGWFYIRSRWNTQCVSVKDDNKSRGASIVQKALDGSASQQWRLIPVGASVEFEAPEPPSNLTAQTDTSNIILNWTASSSNDVSGYTILRAGSDGAYNTIARNVKTTSYNDETAVSGNEYSYKVLAVDRSLNKSTATSATASIEAIGREEFWLEAECGLFGESWVTVSNEEASSDEFLVIKSGRNSTEMPPEELDGQISYEVDVVEGSFVLWARVITPKQGDNSFWVKMDDEDWFSWDSINVNTTWNWEQVREYQLSEGYHTITIAYREDGAQLDKLYLGNDTPTGEGLLAYNSCSGQPKTVWLEAECGQMGNLWDKKGDQTASEGQYIVIKDGNTATSASANPNAHATYKFETARGTYNLWARVLTPSTSDDSFYLKMDDRDWREWSNLGVREEWTWLQVDKYFLESGEHSITLSYREDGAQMDKLYLGPGSPSGLGEAADNCLSELGTVENIESKVFVYPNPVSDYLHLDLPDLWGTEVTLAIYNSAGKQVLMTNLSREEGKVNLAKLKQGLYFVSVSSPTGQHQELKIIKR